LALLNFNYLFEVSALLYCLKCFFTITLGRGCIVIFIEMLKYNVTYSVRLWHV